MRHARNRDEEGQAVLEYILLLSLVVSMYALVMKGLADSKIANKLIDPLKDTYAKVYRYGHPKAKGYDDGGPDYLPVGKGKNSGRIFISPQKN